MDTTHDDSPLDEVQAYQVNEERSNSISFALVLTLLVIGGFIVFLLTASYLGHAKAGVNRWIIIGLYASTLALILASAYFFAFRFFDELFYLFIAIGWLANACYLPFEFLFDSTCSHDNIGEVCFKFLLYTYAISFLSSVSFYVSTLAKPKDASSYSSRMVVGAWVLAVIAFTGGSYLLVNYIRPTSDFNFKFAVYTFPGVLFSLYGLLRVGRHITGVLRHPTVKSDLTLRLLSVTFYAYAILQVAYPFKIYFIEANTLWIFYSLFVIAFAIKITNVYCLVKVLLQVKYPEFVQAKSELETLHERLDRQSQLAALGAISASIEHDMKTPLSGISTKLESMRRRYPDGKIREYIEKLEVDKNRIAAIAKVVPFMRGAQEFYDRDRFMDKVSINELINRSIAAVKVEMALDTKKFFFRIKPPRANPHGKQPQKNIDHFVRAYTPMLEQMVVNLFKNGIEAIRETGKDNGVITIGVTTTRTIPKEIAAKHDLKKYTRWVRVEIEDTGCGIPEENIPKLTSLFTTKNDRKPNGGIGLFIARILIRIHEGCMDITSIEGKGTTVSIYLPEWEAYQSYIMGHPEAMNQDDAFDDDIRTLDAPLDEAVASKVADGASPSEDIGRRQVR